jgi:homoserine O-acetyltransferase
VDTDEHRDLWLPSPTVKLARVELLELEEPFETQHGARLERIQVSYESWGELDPSGENVVLVVHPLASNCHATTGSSEEPPGWWESLIGPGRVLDTDRSFVVCPNLIGGCYGTTGPRFPAPDGDPYLARFPLLTPRDMMRVQRLFLRQLGVRRLETVIGPSMGGMIAWEWAIEVCDWIDRVVVVAAPLKTTAYQIGLNWLQRRGIELDIAGDEQAASWGQMVARGIGMLSYRSPIGLEQKFGRDWFKKPGETLDERGMYNIESWLRHHGKRSVKRYDPYTYILFSRAMDLHDVGEGRGGVVAALERVSCPVLVLGISSDQLYSPAEVHLGADILDHLGKPAAYAEIRSPHGHDAFLLETDQIAEIVGGAPLPSKRYVADATRREEGVVRVGILGAGQVSAHLLRLFDRRRERIREEYGLRFEVALVAEIDREKKLDPVFDGVEVIDDPQELVDSEEIGVVLDLTRGTASLRFVERALERRLPVVTPNKALVREHGALLERLALENGVRLAYHNSIAAGWPLLYAVEGPLGRGGITAIQALLSSACNVILEQIEDGMSLDEAVAFAAEAGLTQPDPELYVSGWDTAQKLTILCARAHRSRFIPEELHVRGLNDLDPRIVRGAPALGYRIKFVGLYSTGRDAPVLGVLPAAVPAEGHLGSIHGEENGVVLDSQAGGEMVFLGSGAGDLPVASAVLGDLVGVFHPARTWTGRFPRAATPPRPPEFARFVAVERAGAVITDLPRTGTVPLLDSWVRPRV